MSAFSVPPFSIHAADSEIKFAYLSNECSILPLRGKERKAFLNVPAEMFQIVETLMHPKVAEDAREYGAFLYLDQVDDKHWVFGIDVGNGLETLDLWHYTQSTLPPWATYALQRKN